MKHFAHFTFVRSSLRIFRRVFHRTDTSPHQVDKPSANKWNTDTQTSNCSHKYRNELLFFKLLKFYLRLDAAGTFCAHGQINFDGIRYKLNLFLDAHKCNQMPHHRCIASKLIRISWNSFRFTWKNFQFCFLFFNLNYFQ